MYVGKDFPDYTKKNMDLHVDGWQMHEVQSMETGHVHSKESIDGEQEGT